MTDPASPQPTTPTQEEAAKIRQVEQVKLRKRLEEESAAREETLRTHTTELFKNLKDYLTTELQCTWGRELGRAWQVGPLAVVFC